MIHISDSYGRFLPIGPENERYEAGLWRSSPEGNYYKTGHPTPDVIEKARENMHAKHPKTRFVNAHVAMLYYDMDKVAALLDKYPNADVEISATVQDLGRAPLHDPQVFPEVSGPHSVRFRRQSRPRHRGVLGAALEVPRDLRRALRSSGAVALGHRRAAARPLENLRHRPAGRCAAQGLLRQRAALPAVLRGQRWKDSLLRDNRTRWWIAGLLFASTTINYIDRQTLSVLAPYLKRDYGWSNSDFALIVIAFRAAYTIFQAVSGRLLDRLGTRRGLSLAVLWYSVVAMATSAATGLKSFAMFRFLLGAGEAANWPGATKAVSEWFPESERDMAVAIFDSGSAVGGAIAPVMVVWLYNSFGSWRPAFVITGLLGLVWLIVWRRVYPVQVPSRGWDSRPHRGRAGILDCAVTAQGDLGDRARQGAHRSRVVFHHRLVRDLSCLEGLQTGEHADRFLGAIPGGGSRQFRRAADSPAT